MSTTSKRQRSYAPPSGGNYIDISAWKSRNTPIACRKCHARKVKCSGGWPCTNCSLANSGRECTYPDRVRHVKVSQTYIDELLGEVQRLRQIAHIGEHINAERTPVVLGTTRGQLNGESGAVAETTRAGPTASFVVDPSHAASIINTDPSGVETETGESVRNPLFEDRPWFFPLTPEMPILIGEATDTAFATRFRQALSGKSQTHIPRTQHVKDETLTSLWQSECAWPSPARARFLIKVSLNTVCRRYYLVRRSTILEGLEQALGDPAMCDKLFECKLFALFALGEVNSTRATSSVDQFPGISYYSNATRMLRMLSERPRIDCVEVMVMLSLYCQAMNRRHTAYCMIGCAVRFGVLMGLHLDVPQHQLSDPTIKEHRNRVWWTVYTLDRCWASMLGQPVSVPDGYIDANLPSTQGLPEAAIEDFAEPEYLTASLRVAHLAAHITESVYNRKMQRGSFSNRVQRALRDLSSWVQDLPDHLRIDFDVRQLNLAMPIVNLHLYFNQCLILATRPILLHMLRTRRNSSKVPFGDHPPRVTETALSLSQACVRCARRSYCLLTDSWINGSFPTFDYTFAQYLFSASIILAISSICHVDDCQSDGDDFESAAQILRQLDQNGNFAAKEFSQHIDAIKTVLPAVVPDQSQLQNNFSGSNLATTQGLSNPTRDGSLQLDGLTNAAGTTRTEPLFQDFLLGADLDLSFLEPSTVDGSFQDFFWLEGGGTNQMDS